MNRRPEPDPSGVGAGPLDGPRLELDDLLGQLIDRAQDVRSAQNRLRGLLRANNAIVGDLALPVVLRRIVEAACELVDARYGALGVIAPAGGLEQFIHVGMDADTVERIGHLPEGRGLLGALIDDPSAIRLHAIADDPRSAGLPANHPPMTNFLGVPIRVRDAVFGNLYLTGHDDGDFSLEDQELVSSLAATAGVAIENARLFDEARRRQGWLQASTDITRQLLASEGEEPLSLIARSTLTSADADSVTVVLPTADGRHALIEVATGVGADDLTAMSYPLAGTLSAQVLDSGLPALVDDMSAEQDLTVHMSEVVDIGALMALPLVGAQRTRGVLLVARLVGRPRFAAADLEMATTFANHAAIALELADARADQQRVALLEDRERIARDLHDHVIQRLFASGLTVQSVASGMDSTAVGHRLGGVVDDIDETIRQIRSSIFELRGALVTGSDTTRAAVLQVASELTGPLGFRPAVHFDGPVDSVSDAGIGADVVAVVREALTNVAKHAGATRAAVRIALSAGALTVEVHDDGTGIGDTDRRSGLANLRTRAERRGGTMTVSAHGTSGAGGDPVRGTAIRWTVPIT